MIARVLLVFSLTAVTALAAPLGAPPVSLNIVREAGEITVNAAPVSVVRYTWLDSHSLPRSVSLVPPSVATAGYAVQMSYYDNGLGRHVYINADPGGDGGFGYFVSHELFRTFTEGGEGTIASLHAEDDSPLGRYLPSTGSDHVNNAWQAVEEFRLSYPRWGTVATIPDPSTGTISNSPATHQKFNLPVVIRWTFQVGQDYPLWSVDYDLSAASDYIATDVRAPYGVMSFNEGASPAVTLLKWGDLYHFAADAGASDFATTASPPGGLAWTWNAANNGRRYNVLGAGAYELGLVDTVTRPNSKYADGYANSRGLTSATAANPACAYGMQSMPCDWEWAYQSFQFEGSPTRPKLAWGTSPFLGSSIATAYVTADNQTEPLSGKGHISYAVHIVFGRAGTGAPLTAARAATPIEALTLLTTDTVPSQAGGSVSYTILGDAGGPYPDHERVLPAWASVRLSPNPPGGYAFDYWEDCPACVCGNSTGVCLATMSQSLTARAQFVLPNTLLAANPRVLNFGDRPMGAPSPAKAFALGDRSNGSQSSLTFQVSNPQFVVDTGGCATVSTLPQVHGCLIQVTFAPLAGGGATPPATTVNGTLTVGSNVSAPIVIDLRGVGTWKNEMLWRNSSTGQVWHMRMNGFAATSAHLAYTEPNTAWKIVSDADFNADGLTDLLWRNTATGQVYYMPLNASGSPSGGAVVTTEPNAAWKIVATPDLDGDGNADILWQNTATGQVYAMLMRGSFIRAQGFVYNEPNTNWKIVAVGDFAGSGRFNQLLWRNSSTGQVYLLTLGSVGGVSLGPSGGALIYTEPNTAWKIIATADFNGDGRTDILWRNDATGMVYMMLMGGSIQSPFIASAGIVYQEPNLAWKIVAVGDYNGDGKADLLWRNDSTGQVYMMLMNGLTIASQAMVYTEPNTAWKILGPWEYSQ